MTVGDYPQLAREDNVAKNTEIWNNLDDLGCDASVEYATSLQYDPVSFDNGKAECDVKVMGSPLYSFPIAWPVGADVAESISYWIRYLVDEESVWIELSEKYSPAPGCDYTLSLADAAEASLDTESLTASQFIGPLLIISVAGCVALALHLCGPVANKATERASVYLSPAVSLAQSSDEREDDEKYASPRALEPSTRDLCLSRLAPPPATTADAVAPQPHVSPFSGWACAFAEPPESPKTAHPSTIVG